MKLLKVVALATALSLAGAAHAGDPFDDARYAIGVKDTATAVRLIDSGRFDVNMQNGEGYTLLHFAAGEGNLAMVEALLERGADPKVKNSLGRTPLDQAIGTMVAGRLRGAMGLKYGIPAKRSGTGDFDKIRTAIGWRNNDTAISELDKGIDINMQNGEGDSLLHFAASEGNLPMLEELLRRGANPNLKNEVGFTPLDNAVGAMVAARLRAAGGRSGKALAATSAAAPAKPATAAKPVAVAKAAAPAKPAKPAQPATTVAEKPKTEREKMCAARHYSSSALCSDSTCKMREYRKWQTCLKTGSYY